MRFRSAHWLCRRETKKSCGPLLALPPLGRGSALLTRICSILYRTPENTMGGTLSALLCHCYG